MVSLELRLKRRVLVLVHSSYVGRNTQRFTEFLAERERIVVGTDPHCYREL